MENVGDIQNLFSGFREHVVKALLFLKNVRSISVFERTAGGSPKQLYKVQAKTSQVRSAHQNLLSLVFQIPELGKLQCAVFHTCTSRMQCSVTFLRQCLACGTLFCVTMAALTAIAGMPTGWLLAAKRH